MEKPMLLLKAALDLVTSKCQDPSHRPETHSSYSLFKEMAVRLGSCDCLQQAAARQTSLGKKLTRRNISSQKRWSCTSQTKIGTLIPNALVHVKRVMMLRSVFPVICLLTLSKAHSITLRWLFTNSTKALKCSKSKSIVQQHKSMQNFEFLERNQFIQTLLNLFNLSNFTLYILYFLVNCINLFTLC